MKASSLVMTNLQYPMTVFGLPPKLMGVLVGAIAGFDVVLIIIGYGHISLLVSVVLFSIGTVFVYRIGKRDPHCETSLLLPAGFWSGRQHQRELITGKPQT